MVSDPLADALNALTRFLVADVSVGEALRRVADISVAAIPAAEIAGISLLSDQGKPTTGVFTDERSPPIDEAQYSSGRGPCLSAWREARTVRLDDLTAAERDYPEFSRAARDFGFHSTLSLPLIAGERGIGALNLYAASSDPFTESDEVRGQQLATAASVVPANASAYWAANDLSEHLREAMQSRAVIEQAKGMLMANNRDLSPDGAFDILRRASQRENVKLRDIAQRLVERRRLDPDNAPS